MESLINRFKLKREISKFETIQQGSDAEQTVFAQFALLEGKQLDAFARGLFNGNDNVWDKLHEKTGNTRLTTAEGKVFKAKRDLKNILI